MHDAPDFSIPIVVMPPERRVADDHAATKLFHRANLPGVDLRPAPPPRPRASPLSDDDEKRMLRRTQAYRRIAWAQRLLDRFQFEERP